MKKLTLKKMDTRLYAAWFIVLALVIIFSLIEPQFRSFDNMMTILRQVSIVGIMALGMSFILITANIDLSIGSLVAFTGTLTALLIVNVGIPIWIAIALGLVAAGAIGAISGFILTLTNIPSLILSLGMMMVVRGAAYLLSGGVPVYGLPAEIAFIGQGFIGPVPVPAVILVVLAVASAFVLNKTFFGRYIYAVGANAEAARLSGINVQLIQRSVFVIGGVIVGIAGIVMMSRVNSGQPSAATSLELDVLIACVIGGISARGGEGRIMGLIGGVLAMGILSNGMAVMGLSDYHQMLMKGAVLIVAVGLDYYLRTRTKTPKQLFAASPA